MTRDIRELPDFRRPGTQVFPAERAAVATPQSPMRQAFEDQAAMGVAAAQQAVMERRAKMEEAKVRLEEIRLANMIEEENARREERERRRDAMHAPPEPKHDPMMAALLERLTQTQSDTQAQLRQMQEQILRQTEAENARMRELLQKATEKPPEKDPVSMLSEMLGVQRQITEMAKLAAPPPLPPGSGGPADAGTMIEVMKAQNLHEIEKAKLAMLQQQQADERQMKLMQIQDQASRTDMFGNMIKSIGTPTVSAALKQGASMLGIGGSDSGTTATEVPQPMMIQCTHCGGQLQVNPDATSAVCPHCAWTVHDQGPPTPPRQLLGGPDDDNVITLNAQPPPSLARPMPPGGDWETM